MRDVPETEFIRWRQLGFTHIWLMGLWTSGPRVRAQALADASLRAACAEALPDWTEADIGGSPYALEDYRVPSALGGAAELSDFRRRLNRYGLKLLLDFVPNHLGLDHAWVRDRPELFVSSATPRPETFLQETVGGPRWLAHGKDPYWPPWSDTVQLDYRLRATHAAMTGLLTEVAGSCDGVRCDMAMLLLTDVFERSWRSFPPTSPQAPAHGEFWAEAIQAIRRVYPDFLFLAEAYWGLEPRLQELGFDYTYDKLLYDHIVQHDPVGISRHVLGKAAAALAAGAHFLENHDEPRAASRLSFEEHRAAALLVLGLPGLRLLHEGQLTGARRKVPVQLLRRPAEPAQPDIRQLYERLLSALATSAVGQGRGTLLAPREAWPRNPSAQDLVLVQWNTTGVRFDLVAVNLAPHRSQCYAPLAVEDLVADWTITDSLSEERYARSSQELHERGLYLDLAPYGVHLFRLVPAS